MCDMAATVQTPNEVKQRIKNLRESLALAKLHQAEIERKCALLSEWKPASQQPGWTELENVINRLKWELKEYYWAQFKTYNENAIFIKFRLEKHGFNVVLLESRKSFCDIILSI